MRHHADYFRLYILKEPCKDLTGHHWRLLSPKAATREKAKTATLFTENRQPESGTYLALPRTSSENRPYIPIGFLDSNVIAANDLQFIPNATLYHFGIVTSKMHMAWMRITSGRLKSDIRYSVKCTYNNFPWPTKPTKKLNDDVEFKAQKVLDVRKAHTGKTLADLYNPPMPKDLADAHKALDDAVDACYGYTGKKDDAVRVAFLFRMYGELVKK